MKILSLNTWGGRAGREKILGFLREQADSGIDVFCLQEVWSAPYEHLEGTLAGGLAIKHDDIMTHGMQDIADTLPDYEYFFHPHYMDNYGLMMLVRKDIDVIGSGDVFVYKDRNHIVTDGDIGNHARNIQYMTTNVDGKKVTIINFHGLWNGKGKGDSDDRLAQSENILRFIRGCESEVAICGDFNLLPETESIRLFEHAGLRNLIREYGITSTRTEVYTKPEKFADYAFVTAGLTVSDFRVLPDVVSDHAPMYLNIA